MSENIISKIQVRGIDYDIQSKELINDNGNTILTTQDNTLIQGQFPYLSSNVVLHIKSITDKTVTVSRAEINDKLYSLLTNDFAVPVDSRDLNEDGLVDTNDAAKLLLHISIPDQCPLPEDVNADFNGDDELTTDDVVQLLLHISMPNMFPIQNNNIKFNSNLQGYFYYYDDKSLTGKTIYLDNINYQGKNDNGDITLEYNELPEDTTTELQTVNPNNLRLVLMTDNTPTDLLHVVGNGITADSPANAYTLDIMGNAWFAGDIYVGGTGQHDQSAKKVLVQEGATTGENAIALGGGSAEGTGSIVIGSGAATGTGSTVIGSGTASGDYSVAEGAKTIAGCKGYYIKAIDPNNNKIYLCNESVNPTWDLTDIEIDSNFVSGYEILGEEIPYGNEFSVSADGYYHWVFAGNIDTINGNCITYSSESLNNSDKWINENGQYNDELNPCIFFVPTQPECGSTNVGLGSHAEGFATHAAAQHSHAEGYYSIVAGRYGHSEGRSTRAGFAAHAEGQETLASGLYSHAEGARTEALDSGSHAEGAGSVAYSVSSHAEGQDTHAIGYASHSEGQQSISEGSRTHAEGFQTVAKGVYSHAEGGNTTAYAKGSHAEGLRATSLGLASHAEGYSTKKASDVVSGLSADTKIADIQSVWKNTKFSAAIGDGSHVEGKDCLAGTYSHAEGLRTIAQGYTSHAEGWHTIAYGELQHVQGKYNIEDIIRDTEGNPILDDTGNVQPTNKYAHIVGNGSSTERSNAHTLDWDGNAWFAGDIQSKGEIFSQALNIADNLTVDNQGNLSLEGNLTFSSSTNIIGVSKISFVETETWPGTLSADTIVGYRTTGAGEIFNDYNNNKATGTYAHAEGQGTKATGAASHASGINTIASKSYSAAFGQGTITPTENSMVIGRYNDEDKGGAFIIGAGTSSAPKNVLRATFGGNVLLNGGTYNTTGADYAEYFEWSDNNLNNEDRIGHFVALDNNNQIKIANLGDEILGIVSGSAAIVGDAYEDNWNQMFLTDIYGRPIYEEVEVQYPIDKDENGNPIYETIIEKHSKLNPDYDPTQTYIPRSKRPEWAPVGLLGKLVVIDDGTCVPGSKCICGINGTATASDTGYHVLKRLDDTHIQILLK